MCANCHVVCVQAELRDLEAIKLACRRVGWVFREGQPTFRWYRSPAPSTRSA
jgi:hypothetical protein